MVLVGSKLPKNHEFVLPFPMTLSATKGFDLFSEWQCPKAPFMTTSLEAKTDIIP